MQPCLVSALHQLMVLFLCRILKFDEMIEFGRINIVKNHIAET